MVVFVLAMIAFADLNVAAKSSSTSVNLDQEIDFGGWKQARELYEQILRKNPNDPDALLAQARIYGYTGKNSAAISNCTKVLVAEPKYASALFIRGQLLWKVGKRRDGNNDFKQLRSIIVSSKDLVSRHRLALLKEYLDDWELAKLEYEKIVNSSSKVTSIDDLFIRAFAQMALSHYKDATATFTKIRPFVSNAPLFLTCSGYCQGMAGDLPGAAKKFALVAKQQPKFFNNQGNWALVLKHAHKFDEAIYHFNIAIQIDKQSLSAINHRGLCYLSKGAYTLALKDFDRALVIDPESQFSLLNRAFVFDSMGRYEDAIRDTKRVIALDPKNASAWSRLSDAEYSLKHWNEAFEASNQALKLRPNYVWALHTRADSENALGEHTKALADYATAIKLEPKSASTYFSRGLLFRDEQKYKESIADFTKAIQIDPKHATYFCARGCSEVRSGKYNQAINDCTQSIKLNPERAHPYESRGEAYFATGKYDLALRDFSTLIKILPDYAEGLEDRAKVYKKLKKMSLAEADIAAAKRLRSSAQKNSNH